MNMTSKRSGLLRGAVLAVAAGAFGCELLVTFPAISDAGPDVSFVGDVGTPSPDATEEVAADAGSDAPEDAEPDASSDVNVDAEDASEDVELDAPLDSPFDAANDAPPG
jgi:hypothetical protein